MTANYPPYFVMTNEQADNQGPLIYLWSYVRMLLVELRITQLEYILVKDQKVISTVIALPASPWHRNSSTVCGLPAFRLWHFLSINFMHFFQILVVGYNGQYDQGFFSLLFLFFFFFLNAWKKQAQGP